MEIIIFLAAYLWLSKSIAGGRIVLVKTALNIPIIIFIILVVIQYLVGKITSTRLGTVYPYATRVYFFEILSYMLAFLLIVNTFKTRRQVNRLLFSMISIGIALAVYGIIQKLASATKVFWFREAPEALNFYSSHLNSNSFANYINMVVFLTLGAFLAYSSHLDKKRRFYRFDIFEGWNGLFLFSIIMMAASLFHTFSQGAIVSFLMTGCLFYYISFTKGISNRRALIVILISSAALVIVALFLIWGKGGSNYLYELLQRFKNPDTYILRISTWSRALNLVKRNPFLGTGLGTFIYIFPKYKPNYRFLFAHCDSDYLELLTETGFVGFAIFLLGMSVFLKRYLALLNLRDDPYVKGVGYGCLMAAFSESIHSSIDSTMHIGADALLFSFILSIGLVAIHNRIASNGDEVCLFKTSVFIITKRSKKIYLFLISSLVFLFLISNVISIGIADIFTYFGEKGKNIEYIKMAVKLEPSSSEYHGLLGDMMLSAFQAKKKDKEALKSVMDEFKKSINLNPNTARYHMRLGWIYSFLGDEKKAIEEFKKAQELEPLEALYYIILAIHYFNKATKMEGVNPYGSEAMEEGLAEYKKALSVDPSVNIDHYKNYLKDHIRIMETLKKYSL